MGLVHIRGSFYYHAWPEVWLGEWVAVDPTLGQAPPPPLALPNFCLLHFAFCLASATCHLL